MGGFLTVAGIAGAKLTDVERALREYGAENGRKFARDTTGLSYPDGIVITAGEAGRVSVLLPSMGADSAPVAISLSKTLKSPVFLLHIHDGDFWMYWLFADGKEIDCFNPIPDYWDDDVSDRDRKKCAGNARKVAQYWPELQPAKIDRYLVTWNLKEGDSRKAYPDDTHGFNDCRQLIDFMKRLRLRFPLDDEDNPVGKLYRFEVRQ